MEAQDLAITIEAGGVQKTADKDQQSNCLQTQSEQDTLLNIKHLVEYIDTQQIETHDFSQQKEKATLTNLLVDRPHLQEAEVIIVQPESNPKSQNGIMVSAIGDNDTNQPKKVVKARTVEQQVEIFNNIISSIPESHVSCPGSVGATTNVLSVTQQQNKQPLPLAQQQIRNSLLTETRAKQEPKQLPISVEVGSSWQVGPALAKQTIYSIMGKDKHGRFDIERKYNQFVSLRKILVSRWPSSFIPFLSNKSEVKKGQYKQMHLRYILTNFLLGLSYSQRLFYKEEVQLFLRSPSVEISEMFEQMPVLKHLDIINRFKTCFGDDFETAKENDIARINKFVSTLKTMSNYLAALVEKALALAEKYDYYAQMIGRFGFLQRMYEQLSLAEFTNHSRQQTIFIRDQDNRIDKLKVAVQSNHYYKLYFQLESQRRDAEAFAETIITMGLYVLRRDELEKEIRQLQIELDQLALGQTTIKSLASRKSKDDFKLELQQKQKRLFEEKVDVTDLSRIIENVLIEKEIDIFKKFRRDKYKKLLLKEGTMVVVLHQELQVVWKFVNEESRVLKVSVCK